MSLRSLPLRLLLALLLVCAQQQAVLHEMGHVFDRLAHQTGRQQPQKDVCATCVAFAGMQHAADAHVPLLPVVPARFACPGDVHFASATAAFLALYLSRAPPTRS